MIIRTLILAVCLPLCAWGQDAAMLIPFLQAPASSVSDGNDSYVKLLLHCDGANGGTNFPDSSASANNVTTVGTAQNTTAVKKFGTAALLLDGDSDYLTIPASTNFNFGYGAFTYDFWVNLHNVAANAELISSREGGVRAFGMTYVQSIASIQINHITVWPTSSLMMRIPFSPATNVWYHIAFVRIDNADAATSWRGFINGTNQTLTLVSGAWSNACPIVGNYIAIGRNGDDPSGYADGQIDEVRISKGIARWTNNFTPPTQSYGE